MNASYDKWLMLKGKKESTIRTQISRVNRVETDHGDLDKHYTADSMASLIEKLTYSKKDKKDSRLNPSNIKIDGDIYNGLSSYRNAIMHYKQFLDSGSTILDGKQAAANNAPDDQETGQRIGLERDLQAALRNDIEQLERGLTIIDDGVERSVASGFIDITTHDASGMICVIELKAGTAARSAIGQILSYMGDVTAEEENRNVRGILVASDFDSKAQAAARMVPNLVLRKYSVQFKFSDGHE